MLYIAVLTYIRPVEEIDACLADHIAWLEEGYAAGAFIASGRRVHVMVVLFLQKAIA